jgi:hypothetical protein
LYPPQSTPRHRLSTAVRIRIDDDDAEEVQNDDDLRLLERLRLGNDNDDDDTVPPLEHGVESTDMRDSDDDYDPNIPDYDDYF